MTENKDEAIVHHEAEATHFDELARDQWDLARRRQQQGRASAHNVAYAEWYELRAADERKLIQLREKAIRDHARLEENLPGYHILGDDYPRLHCRAELYVREDGFLISVYYADGKLRGQVGPADTPAGAARMLQDWCEGREPRPAEMADRS